MKKLIFIIAISIILVQCENYDKEPVSYHNHNYHFVTVPFSEMKNIYSVYIPVYSEIYHQHGRKFDCTITLSIRNTNFKDSLYLFNVDYNDSKGDIIRNYIDSTLLLYPMESVEFHVDENKNRAGANFIVKWGSKQSGVNKPIIQAVMIGSFNQQGMSFTTDGVEIDN